MGVNSHCCFDVSVAEQFLRGVYINPSFKQYGRISVPENMRRNCGLVVVNNITLVHPNCRHTVSTWIEGLSKMPKPMNIREIERVNKLEAEQRRMERSIRKQKRRILAAEQNPNDKDRLQQAQIKYQVLDQEYKRFSKAAGLRLQHERTKMAGFGPKQAMAAERLTNNISKMAKADEIKNDWSEAIARTVTKEEKSALIAYAADRGIKIPGLNYFDGDPDLLKAQIDALSTVSQQLPTGKKLVLSVSKSLPDEDFAETVGNHITVNNKALRNRKVTEANLAAGGVFSSSKAEAVVIHEYGHVITAAKGNKGVEIAQKACYNIFGENLDMGDILKILRREVSPYSTTYYAKRNSPFAFDSSRYKEIIPEILAKNSFGQNELTVEFVKILKEML